MSQDFELSAVLNELLYGNEVMESVEQTLHRLVTPDFTQRINGQVYRRSEYAAHVCEMRRLVAGGGEMQVLEQVVAGESIAGRYLFRMVPADGQEMIGESHLFARRRDGRVGRFVEVARWVEDADDEDLLLTVIVLQTSRPPASPILSADRTAASQPGFVDSTLARAARP